MEIFKGDVIRYDFYASRVRECLPNLHDASNLIYLYGNPHGLRQAISNPNNRIIRGNDTFFISRMYSTNINQLHTSFDSNLYRLQIGTHGLLVNFGWKLSAFNEFLVNKLLDSKKGVTLKDVYRDYRETLTYNISYQTVFRMSNDFYEYVKDTEMFLFKKQYIEHYPKTSFFNFFQIKDMQVVIASRT